MDLHIIITGIFNSTKMVYSFLPVISFFIIASNFIFFFFYLIASKNMQKRKCQLLYANYTSWLLLVFTSKNSIFFFTGIYEILGKRVQGGCFTFEGEQISRKFNIKVIAIFHLMNLKGPKSALKTIKKKTRYSK